MTSWPPPVDGEPTYPAEDPQPGGYPSRYPQQQQYPPPYPYQYPPPYPYGPGAGYGWPPGMPRRPGSLTAAAVLGYINAGLITLAGILLFTGASVLTDVDATTGVNLDSLRTEFILDGMVNLVAAGLLISGGVAMCGRRASGRRLYTVGSSLVLAATVYWMVRWTNIANHFAGILVYGLLFAALAVVGLSLAWVREAGEWLRVTQR